MLNKPLISKENAKSDIFKNSSVHSDRNEDEVPLCENQVLGNESATKVLKQGEFIIIF